MKLDDRPVIDQLLSPTPLNILEDVRVEMQDAIHDSAPKTQESVDGHLFTLLELIPEDERDAGFDRISAVAEAVRDDEVDRAVEWMEAFADALEARL